MEFKKITLDETLTRVELCTGIEVSADNNDVGYCGVNNSVPGCMSINNNASGCGC